MLIADSIEDFVSKRNIDFEFFFYDHVSTFTLIQFCSYPFFFFFWLKIRRIDREIRVKHMRAYMLFPIVEISRDENRKAREKKGGNQRWPM